MAERQTATNMAQNRLCRMHKDNIGIRERNRRADYEHFVKAVLDRQRATQ